VGHPAFLSLSTMASAKLHVMEKKLYISLHNGLVHLHWSSVIILVQLQQNILFRFIFVFLCRQNQTVCKPNWANSTMSTAQITKH
jgi:hypothetical protein